MSRRSTKISSGCQMSMFNYYVVMRMLILKADVFPWRERKFIMSCAEFVIVLLQHSG
jgi:hypothetical protein